RVDTLDSQTAELEQVASAIDEGEPADETGVQDVSQRRAFDINSLVASGIDREEADSLRALWEEVQLARMYLTDEAEREGWSGTARHRQELRALETGLREELSPEIYDRYLYATGKKNRARVVDVIGRSPGERAGFAMGDTILSYDGQRVFSVDEVRKLSSSGRPGEVVRIEVARGDSTAVLEVPRGPIGLMLMPHAEPPR
ncbi:MAG: PDZ domain-containing protein, partial [Deltaproteobacteria bacterium]|nr:PDZ domain-containing protein [Deltaproteobacteria bacterium]